MSKLILALLFISLTGICQNNTDSKDGREFSDKFDTLDMDEIGLVGIPYYTTSKEMVGHLGPPSDTIKEGGKFLMKDHSLPPLKSEYINFGIYRYSDSISYYAYDSIVKLQYVDLRKCTLMGDKELPFFKEYENTFENLNYPIAGEKEFLEEVGLNLSELDWLVFEDGLKNEYSSFIILYFKKTKLVLIKAYPG